MEIYRSIGIAIMFILLGVGGCFYGFGKGIEASDKYHNNHSLDFLQSCKNLQFGNTDFCLINPTKVRTAIDAAMKSSI